MLHFIHDWITVKDTGKHKYQECIKCGKRRIVEVTVGGYQPIDKDWLKEELYQEGLIQLENRPITSPSARVRGR